jgi:uncharacterized membrane protein
VPELVSHHGASFSGPLPHPALFSHYDRVQPGYAERIMRMTEKRLDHQIRMEQGELGLRQKIADAEIRNFTRGQWFTFVLVVIFLTVAGISLFREQALGGAAAGIAALATVACALLGRRTAEREIDSADGADDGDDLVADR